MPHTKAKKMNTEIELNSILFETSESKETEIGFPFSIEKKLSDTQWLFMPVYEIRGICYVRS